ncbi:MAG: mechanosensitive ion channel family protein [Planctomycetes bacterium]|nr:mechanosensitive ion channel family protein [Planctomycetota bacterium]
MKSVWLVGVLVCFAGVANGQALGSRETPRGSLQTFLQFMSIAEGGDGRALLEAVDCLDLSELPAAQRDTLGPLYAGQLYSVLQQLEAKPGAAPTTREGEPYVVYYDALGRGAVILERSERGWVFNSATIRTLPVLSALLTQSKGPAARAQASEKPKTVYEWLLPRVPHSLRGRAFLLEHWQWLGLALIWLTGILLDRISMWMLLTATLRMLKRRKVDVDEKVARGSTRPFGLLVMSVFWWVCVGVLGLPANVAYVVVLAIRFVAAVAGVWAAYRVVDVVCSALEKRSLRTENRFDDLLVPLVRKSAKVAVVVFGLVFVADTLDFSVSSLLAGLGLAGMAVALAAQDTVKNFFGSLTVVLDRPFEVGDWVLIDGVEGSVEEVGFRSTRVRTFYNSVISLPNAKLLTATVDNMGARHYRRWKTTVQVTYDTPPDRLEAMCEGIRELVRRAELTRKDYFQVYVTGMAASGIDILVYVFFATPDWGRELRARHQLILDILRLAKKLDVGIAFPSQTLYLTRPTDSPEETFDTADAMGHGRKLARELLEAASPSGGNAPALP